MSLYNICRPLYEKAAGSFKRCSKRCSQPGKPEERSLGVLGRGGGGVLMILYNGGGGVPRDLQNHGAY